MKKILGLMLLVVLLFSLTGCKKDANDTSKGLEKQIGELSETAAIEIIGSNLFSGRTTSAAEIDEIINLLATATNIPYNEDVVTLEPSTVLAFYNLSALDSKGNKIKTISVYMPHNDTGDIGWVTFGGDPNTLYSLNIKRLWELIYISNDWYRENLN